MGKLPIEIWWLREVAVRSGRIVEEQRKAR
jgi:hypothetical protein